MSIEQNLPREWRRWVGENAMLRVGNEQIVEAAVAAGLERAVVETEVRRALDDPYVEAGRCLAERLRKLETMLRIRVEVVRQSGEHASIEARRKLPAGQFQREFYARNRPVKLLGMIDAWPACHSWRPEYFLDRFGRHVVEITSSRDADPRYEINLEKHRRSILFGDFIRMVLSGAPGNNCYLVANNRFFEKPGMGGLLDDLGPFPGYLREGDRAPNTYLWFGPAGTITPLHHDAMNVLFCQIHGSKRIALISPDEAPWLYNQVGVFSEVDYENPDFRRFPLFRHVQPIEVEMHSGEVLFIPVGWWHHVRSLETSISVSFTNFVVPNEYQWSARGGSRD